MGGADGGGDGRGGAGDCGAGAGERGERGAVKHGDKHQESFRGGGPDAEQAIDGEEKRVRAVIKEIKEILAAEGFELLARIEIRDKLTGRCYR